jgi:parallel beta-helix repeat protein
MNKGVILGILISLGIGLGMGSLSVANATIIYVDVVNGDDVTGDGTQENPYQTIGKGIEMAMNGDTVQCAPGTYIEAVFINKQIMLIGAGADNTIIDSPEYNWGVIFSGDGADNALIEGFRITGAYFDGIKFEAGANPMVINNTIIQNGYSGIFCKYSWGTIINNTIIKNGKHGICNAGASSIITNNIIRENAWNNILCYHCSPIITNNTIINGNECGIFSHHYAAPIITNNIISENSNAGISAIDNSFPIISYNNVYGNNPNYGGDCVPGYMDISEPPQFVDAENGDYHLMPTSPCIDAGTNTAPALPDTDMDGNPRIINGVVDIGAYEYQEEILELAIDIILSGNEFHTGNTLTIDAHVTNGNEEVDVEGKCWVRFPDEELVSLLNVYHATLPPELDVTIPLLPGGYTFTGDEPGGEYEVGGRLACPITLDYYSTDIETFTFTP